MIGAKEITTEFLNPVIVLILSKGGLVLSDVIFITVGLTEALWALSQLLNSAAIAQKQPVMIHT